MKLKKKSYDYIDFPQYKNYVKNIIIDAEKINGTILVISAVADLTDDFISKTKEYILLSCYVGIKSIVVYLNKCDKVNDEAKLISIEEKIKKILSECGKECGFVDLDKTSIIRGSALNALNGNEENNYGQESIKKLLEALDGLPDLVKDVDKPFFMPLADVYKISGIGTVPVGKIEKGTLKLGDQVEIITRSGMISTEVKSIEMHESLPEAYAGDNIGVNVKNVSVQEISRGMALVKYNERSKQDRAKGSIKFKALIYKLTPDEGGVENVIGFGYTPVFDIHTAHIACRITLLEPNPNILEPDPKKKLMSGQFCFCIAESSKGNIPLLKYMTFSVMDMRQTVAIGIITQIIENDPPPVGKKK